MRVFAGVPGEPVEGGGSHGQENKHVSCHGGDGESCTVSCFLQWQWLSILSTDQSSRVQRSTVSDPKYHEPYLDQNRSICPTYARLPKQRNTITNRQQTPFTTIPHCPLISGLIVLVTNPLPPAADSGSTQDHEATKSMYIAIYASTPYSFPALYAQRTFTCSRRHLAGLHDRRCAWPVFRVARRRIKVNTTTRTCAYVARLALASTTSILPLNPRSSDVGSHSLFTPRTIYQTIGDSKDRICLLRLIFVLVGTCRWKGFDLSCTAERDDNLQMQC